jgi:hypothetical protein
LLGATQEIGLKFQFLALVAIDHGLEQLLGAPLPGIVQGVAQTIFRQHQTISSIPRAFASQDLCFKANTKAVGLYDGTTTQQNCLEGPALKPAHPKGVDHQMPMAISHFSRYPMFLQVSSLFCLLLKTKFA